MAPDNSRLPGRPGGARVLPPRALSACPRGALPQCPGPPDSGDGQQGAGGAERGSSRLDVSGIRP